MATVVQPSMNPTNKLTAAIAAAAFMSISRVVVKNIAPEWYDEGLWDAMFPIVVFALGYVIKDAPNVTVVK